MQKERKFLFHLSTSSMKREIRSRNRAKTANEFTKNVPHVQSCCFAYKKLFSSDVLVAVPVAVAVV